MQWSRWEYVTLDCLPTGPSENKKKRPCMLSCVTNEASSSNFKSGVSKTFTVTQDIQLKLLGKSTNYLSTYKSAQLDIVAVMDY